MSVNAPYINDMEPAIPSAPLPTAHSAGPASTQWVIPGVESTAAVDERCTLILTESTQETIAAINWLDAQHTLFVARSDESAAPPLPHLGQIVRPEEATEVLYLEPYAEAPVNEKAVLAALEAAYAQLHHPACAIVVGDQKVDPHFMGTDGWILISLL